MNRTCLAYLNRLLVRETEAQKRWSGRHTVLEPVRMPVGVVIGERHVAEEVVDIGEEVLVGVRDEELVSSRAECSPKTFSPLSRTGLQETGFQRPTVPARGARRKTGWGRWSRQRSALERRGSECCVLCIRWEERPLLYSHKGRRIGSAGRWNEQPGDEPNRFVFISRSGKRFSFRVTVQFHRPVMREKKKGLTPRHIPQTAARVVTRRGGRRRRNARERAFFSHTLTTRRRAHLICWSNSF
jgi:hypothetical protein